MHHYLLCTTITTHVIIRMPDLVHPISSNYFSILVIGGIEW